ncbi:MAG: type II toxin-antitoxin system VapC family toxin [Caulobacteraceae bacterium]|jgi:predicted nucleic acid-binding protein
MLDTNIAIHLRDRDVDVIRRVATLDGGAVISAITRVELESGVYADPVRAAVRRPMLDAILELVPTVAFDEAAAVAYGKIIGVTGFSRRKVLDRMIAAQAIVQGVTLVTLNAGDFRDIPGLDLLAW